MNRQLPHLHGLRCRFVRRSALWLAVSSAALSGAWAQEHRSAPLRVGFPAGYSAPFWTHNEGEPPAGLNADLAAWLERASGRKVQIVILPGRRLDPATFAGEIDLRCHARPDTVPQAEAYQWSVPLWQAPEVLIAGPGQLVPEHLQALPAGRVFSTVSQQRYPALDQRFGVGNWRRDDARDTQAALGKLELGRGAYAITTAWELQHFLAREPHTTWQPPRVPLHPNALHCALPQGSAHTAWLAHLARGAQSGALAALLRAYDLPPTAQVAQGRKPSGSVPARQGERQRQAHTQPKNL